MMKKMLAVSLFLFLGACASSNKAVTSDVVVEKRATVYQNDNVLVQIKEDQMVIVKDQNSARVSRILSEEEAKDYQEALASQKSTDDGSCEVMKSPEGLNLIQCSEKQNDISEVLQISIQDL